MGDNLDLGAIFDRHTVTLPDGTQITLRNPIELGILDDFELRTTIDRIQELSQSGTRTRDDAEEGTKLLRTMVGLVVIDVPEELEDWHCVQIFRFWMEKQAQTPEPADPRRSRRTTGASSRGSKSSTAATRKRGSGSKGGR
jgi:hypothetical protein